MKYIIGNWKMNPGTARDAVRLSSEIAANISPNSTVKVIVCPPYPYLPVVKANVKSLILGAQDVSIFAGGAYTGQVSAVQLKDLGVEYVIIGHSETRQYLNVKDEHVQAKLKMATTNALLPILCVGAGLKPEDNEARIKAVIRQQLEAGISGFNGEQLIVAYEPTWAISAVGGGKMPDSEHVLGITKFIREMIATEHIPNVSVLYGGNVNSHNVSSYSQVDGYLVGSASLDAHDFSQIVKIISNTI